MGVAGRGRWKVSPKGMAEKAAKLKGSRKKLMPLHAIGAPLQGLNSFDMRSREKGHLHLRALLSSKWPKTMERDMI